MKKPPVTGSRTAADRIGVRKGRAISLLLLAQPEIVAERACGTADGCALDDIMATDMGCGRADTGTDKGAVGIGRIDTLSAARHSRRAQKRGKGKDFGHCDLPVFGLVGA